MISVHVGNNLRIRDLIETYFSMIDSEVIAHDYQSSSFFHKYTIQDLLRVNYDNKKIREEAIECTPNDTVSRRKIWDDNPQIVLPGYAFNDDIDTIRTITTKQDRNPNSGNLYFDSGIEGRSKFRYLTPRECLLFMGFTDADYKKLKDNNIEFHKGDSLFTRDKIIRMAGNSIPVKLLEGIFLQILQIDELLNDYRVYLSTNSTVMSHENKIVSIIRSYMFSKGLRSRLNNEPYPDNANIVYPKYKTAIYVRDCFKHGHGCANLEISEINSNILKNIISKNKAEDQQAYECATDLGWNALILWECQLCPDKISETLMWVENIIKNNCNCNNEKGNIIIYDRY
jgi:DNA mismatch endonuclease Vsr